MPQFRTYAPIENGPSTRIGRTYTTLAACMRVAATLSKNYDFVEIKDDSRPIDTRLLAIARKGQIIDSLRSHDLKEVLA